MNVGTIIKAYDFPGNDTCYFVGSVVEIKNGMITARIIKQVFDGKDVSSKYNPEDTFRTPIQGSSFMDDKFQRVVEIG